MEARPAKKLNMFAGLSCLRLVRRQDLPAGGLEIKRWPVEGELKVDLNGEGRCCYRLPLAGSVLMLQSATPLNLLWRVGLLLLSRPLNAISHRRELPKAEAVASCYRLIKSVRLSHW